MLLFDRASTFAFTYDNWGANPSATIGTSITPGASNVTGSWTAVASSANIAKDIYGIYMQVFGAATSTASKPQLLDIGVDPAGSTSYGAVISSVQVGMSPSLTQAGNREFFFPLFIKAGSSVAVRITGANATAGTVRVPMRFYGQPSRPLAVPVGSYSETLGANTGTSLGTSITPGNAADGSWADLGATTRDMWWWQPGYCIDNGTVTAEYTYLEFAWGDASNKHTMFKIMHGGTTAESCGLAAQTHLLWFAGFNQVPAGAHIYARGRCNNAPDTGYNVTMTGIGG